jgi:hypothetical protein
MGFVFTLRWAARDLRRRWPQVLTAVALSVIAVGVAPLLSARRLRRMDIPGTLRVVE